MSLVETEVTKGYSLDNDFVRFTVSEICSHDSEGDQSHDIVIRYTPTYGDDRVAYYRTFETKEELNQAKRDLLDLFTAMLSVDDV